MLFDQKKEFKMRDFQHAYADLTWHNPGNILRKNLQMGEVRYDKGVYLVNIIATRTNPPSSWENFKEINIPKTGYPAYT